MKKLLLSIILIGLAAYVAYPYLTLYQLDQAVTNNDRASMHALVDLEAIRDEMQFSVLGEEPAKAKADNPLAQWLQDGMRALGQEAVNHLVTMDWVRDSLRSRNDMNSQSKGGMINNVSYAFFEGPKTFIVRVGELGQRPVHVRMQLDDNHRWRVVALYE